MVSKSRLAVSVVALLVVLSVTLVAGAQTSIIYYDASPAGSATQMIDVLIKEFMERNPDITVDVVRSGGYDNTREKALVAWAGGAAPNVVMIEQAQGFGFIMDGLFLPLDEFIEKDPTVWLDDLYPGILEHVTWNGKIWAMPFNTSTPLMYFNRDLFAISGLDPVAPTTWDGILDVSKRIARDSDGDGATDVWGLDFYQWGWLFEAWIGQNGARVASDDGRRFTLNSPEAIEAMLFTQALVQEHRVARQGTGINDFWAGRLAMTERSTASLANHITQAKQNGIDMDVAPLACNVQCFAPIGGGNLHMMNTGTQAQKDAAWRFISFLVDSDNLARFSATTGYMAGRRSAIQSPYLQDHFAAEPRALTTYQQLTAASPRAKVPVWPDMVTPLQQFGTRQHRDNANVVEELNALARYGNQLLDEWWSTRTN